MSYHQIMIVFHALVLNLVPEYGILTHMNNLTVFSGLISDLHLHK